MTKLLFLGTGPANGTKKGTGKSKRLESSVLITTEKGNILIDATQFFYEQREHISSLNAVLITHAHLDAIGGIEELINLFPQTPIYCLKQVEQKIKKHFPELKDYAFFQTLHPYKTISLFGLTLIPTPVRHSIQKGYPTLGFFFTTENKKTLYYASDVASWNKRTERLMRKAETLIIDGTMWHMTMSAHLDISVVLPMLCAWENKRIIFTQIGNTAPEYEELKKEIHRMCGKAVPAYDGMELTF